MTTTVTYVKAGTDRFGSHVMFDDYRSAMPSPELAGTVEAGTRLMFDIRELLELANNACEFLRNGTPIHNGSVAHADLVCLRDRLASAEKKLL